MTEPLGLRGRKKRQTREAIAEAAWRLFMAEGFEAVTVAQVASEAGVSEKTVFNYFATKEDLFYHRLESFEDWLLTAVRNRPKGETVAGAVRRFLLQPMGLLAPKAAREARQFQRRLRLFHRAIAASPALQAREQQIHRHTAHALAELVAAELGARKDDVLPLAVAGALIGVHAAILEYVRRRTIAEDDDPRQLARAVRAQLAKAFQALESGLSRYESAARPVRPVRRKHVGAARA